MTALLVLQGITMFLALPLAGRLRFGYVLLDACHLGFTVISVAVLTRRRFIRLILFAALVLLAIGPSLGGVISERLRPDQADAHEAIALVAFAFNATITFLVAGHVFGGGRVTTHRIRGAVLLYLNVSALFAILYGVLAMHDPASFATGANAVPSHDAPSAFSYFSLATITTTGYGDIVPVHPMARSLANLEAVFGQLFPATLLSRLVALHLAHEGAAPRHND